MLRISGVPGTFTVPGCALSAAASRHKQRGFAGLILGVLVIMMLEWPMVMLFHDLAETQRALDKRISKMLAPTPQMVPASAPGLPDR
jgi:hypothetical protein